MSINIFWVVVAAGSFLIFLNLIWRYGFDPISNILSERKSRIDQGLADAEQARKEREGAALDRDRVVAQARQDAAALMAAAQKSAQEMRDADIAATKAELEQLRQRAADDIQAQHDRALADLRAQVADLALYAAGRVVGETMNEPRQRKLVEDFLRQNPGAGSGGTGSAGTGAGDGAGGLN